jgi:dethiobiotin synthetase
MKYRPIFITATNTDIGKTYATCKLIEELGSQGLRVGVLKPIETGVQEYPLDGKVLLETAKKYNSNLKNFACRDIVPIQYKLPAAPYVSKGNEKIDIKAIHVAYEKIAKVSDVVLIEGAGGLMVPVDEGFYMYDFIKEFNAVTLLVTHANLGCINDTLLNKNILDTLDVDYEWCVNFRNNKKSFEKTTLPYYKKIVSLQEDIKLLSENLLKFEK